ncbi:MAG: SDR family NAD(P)-dependent oxidoreductase [Pseudonocardia sp.]|uniref:SDR family NAD(P)-dependent oxidoreductase n=1 Tax=Pseudonocardia sp. TaxID=60912 RepID=UPI001ACA0D3B|nr:SDR family NAD(P)-dependent oxidoreductase [Pseudonocardia sp.]MBN9102868.1 SDR family NAD(P)-dependent oxidoreductase [Pseudonocardia sp.]
MDLGLTGKVAVVTGASRGIGLAVTRALVEEGAHVVAGSRRTSTELTALVDTGRVRSVSVDLSTPDGPAELVSAAADLGRLDILVNNVGSVSPRMNGFLEVTDDQWLTSITVNLMAAVRTTRAVLPTMLAAGRGAIVTISSVNAFLPDPTVPDYSAAKAALTNFSKALSKEVGPAGIRMNTVSPGPVATDLWLGDGGVAAAVARATGGDPTAVSAAAAAQSVTGRFTQPHEIADLVVLLAGERAGNTTGADFVIDGGLITTT